MAENKEITTLHPYMNRNKNRYPNVKDENIPDTIQRKMTAGTGINISPENVISATGGDSYTRSETDALLDTKADKVALENVNKAVPTDIAVKDGKLGLEHDTTWLTNQNAINLGKNITYDVSTNTLNASGGNLPAGTEADPYILNTDLNVYYELGSQELKLRKGTGWGSYTTDITCGKPKINIVRDTSLNELYNGFRVKTSSYKSITRTFILNFESTSPQFYVSCYDTDYVSTSIRLCGVELPTDNDTYDLIIKDKKFTKRKSTSSYNHYIVITDGTASNAIYLLIPSTNNIICNILTDLDTLLGTEPRFIQASGVVTDTASKLPIVAIKWQGSFSSSKIVTISSEEATTKFTDIVDVVEPA